MVLQAVEAEKVQDQTFVLKASVELTSTEADFDADKQTVFREAIGKATGVWAAAVTIDKIVSNAGGGIVVDISLQAPDKKAVSAMDSKLTATNINAQLSISSLPVAPATLPIANSIVQGVPYSSPEMKGGHTPAASWNASSGLHQESYDATIGRNYYHLLPNTHKLSKTTDADARYLSNVPDFVGTGATISFWYRHTQCSVKTCGVYLLHAGDFVDFGGDGPEWCWTAWIENEAFWQDAGPYAGYVYFSNTKENNKKKQKYPDMSLNNLNVDAKFKPNGDKMWRHFILQFDEVNDKLRLFLDGTMVFEMNLGAAVSEVDCAGTGKRWTLGHSHPG